MAAKLGSLEKRKVVVKVMQMVVNLVVKMGTKAKTTVAKTGIPMAEMMAVVLAGY